MTHLDLFSGIGGFALAAQTDDADNVYPSEKRRMTLVKKVNGTAGTKTGLKLQPGFVEWMMGYPQGWTDLNLPNRDTGKKD